MAITIYEQPKTYYVRSYGESAYFSVIAGPRSISYAWQTRRRTSSTWSTSNQTAPVLFLPTSASTYFYRCRLTLDGEVVYTDEVAIELMSSTVMAELQVNNSENNKVEKDITDILALPCVLKENTSIIDPVFIIEAPLQDITACNYLTIESFNRSYFINNIESISTGLVALSCHVDVLSSFKDEIKANKGIVRRAESETAFNLYINDNSLVAYQDPYILTEPFPNGFTGTAFILAVAGA